MKENSEFVVACCLREATFCAHASAVLSVSASTNRIEFFFTAYCAQHQTRPTLYFLINACFFITLTCICICICICNVLPGYIYIPRNKQYSKISNDRPFIPWSRYIPSYRPALSTLVTIVKNTP